MKASKQEALQRNLALLKQARIEFTTVDGISYATTGPGDVYEFWPTTGSWFNKATGARGKDLRHIVSRNGVCSAPEPAEASPRGRATTGSSYVLKINLNIEGAFVSISSKRFAVTDARATADVREKALRDVAAAIDRELKRAHGRPDLAERKQP